jgi:hypothetical protein
VNWGDEETHAFWDEADAIGISAYFPLASALPHFRDTTQPALDVAWRTHRDRLVAFSRRVQRPLHFTEFGYPSIPSAAEAPWGGNEKPEDQPDPALQARCFAAFRKAWQGTPELARGSIWAVGDPTEPSYAKTFDVFDKPAEAEVRAFFTRRGRR